MSAISIEEQNLLRDAATRFFNERHPVASARRPVDWNDPPTQALWREAADMGFLGSADREAEDAMGMVGAWIVQEAAGASLFQLPIAEAMTLWPVLARAAAGSDREIAHQVLSGMQCAVACLCDGDEEPLYIDHLGGSVPGVVIRPDASGAGYTSARVAPDNLSALVGLEPGARLAAVGELGPATALEVDARDADFPLRWRLCLAAQAVGTASRAFEMTCAFVKEREQFGKPIGANQAVKHRLANYWMALDNARLAGLHAATALDTGAADVRFAVDAAVHVALEAALAITADAIQMHGAIGFSWEHDCHLFLKRALSLASRLGGEGRCLQRLAERIDPDIASA